MLKMIKNLFKGCSDKVKELKDENILLRKEMEGLNEKVLERQEQINKTNAYYKKKIYNLKSSKNL